MTIICYRDGIMAADTASFQGSVMLTTKSRKVLRNNLGYLGAGCGVTTAIDIFTYWFHNNSSVLSTNKYGGFSGCKLDIDEIVGDFSAIIVVNDANVYYVDNKGKVGHDRECPFYAIGAASEFALGAMFNGASAQKAVELCIEHCAYVGGEVQIEALNSNYAKKMHLSQTSTTKHKKVSV